MGLFHKKIVSVTLINQTNGISEDDKLENLAAGHILDGFMGMVAASILNDDQEGTSTFLIKYSNGDTKITTTKNGSPEYKKYINFLK